MRHPPSAPGSSRPQISCSTLDCASASFHASTCPPGHAPSDLPPAAGECCPRVQCVPEQTGYPGVDCSDVPVPQCGKDMGLRRVEPVKGKKGGGGNPCPSYVCGERRYTYIRTFIQIYSNFTYYPKVLLILFTVHLDIVHLSF